LELTASDGTGLKLVELEARAILEDPLAFTELHLVFDNPEDRQLEGRFSITMPEGAALSRLAMKIGDAWQEGEVVEKKAARQAYEDFLHRKQDPALLEQAAGNQFSARVFPIPPRSRKELIVSYSQELAAGKGWSLPLRGLPELGKLTVTATLAATGTAVVRLSKEAFKPTGDLEVERLAPSAGLRSGNLVLARVRPVPEAKPDPLGATVILADTSGSRALGFEEEVRMVDALARSIAASAGAKTPLAVAAFDQTTDPIFEGAAGEWGDAEVQRLRARQAFGASDLGRALGWAEARAAARGYKRVVVLGDGVPTAGETSPGAVGARSQRLAKAGVERLDAVALGGIREDKVLKKLTAAGLPRDGVVADGSAGFAEVSRRISMATRSGIPVVVEGARWSFPRELDGVQPGDEVLVYADVPEGQPVRLSVGAETRTVELVQVARPLLARSFAHAKIDSLLAQAAAEPSPALVQEVVALSTQHRVISPYTSLLVLETEQDFRRFSLDRKALADILTVDSGGRLAVVGRGLPGAPPAVAPQAVARKGASSPRAPEGRMPDAPVVGRPPVAGPAPQAAAAPARSAADGAEFGMIGLLNTGGGGEPNAPTAPWGRDDSLGNDPLSARGNMWGGEIGDSYGAGGLGLTGVGEGAGSRGEGIGLGAVGTVGHGAGTGNGQGFGSGNGRLGGAHRTASPQIRQGATQVSGRLPPEVIQRIVRQNFGRFRLCYEDGLRRNPRLVGRISVRFTIGRDGSVTGAGNGGSDMPDQAVTDCVARSFVGLSFPSPESGTVTVVYPIMFSHDGSALPPREQGSSQPPRQAPERPNVEPYTGRFKSVMDMIGAGGAKAAVDEAFGWHRAEPGNVMALVALGESLEAAREPQTAARAYGSIVDLFPARADLRRFAGHKLERLGGAAMELAVDTFAKAEEQRPDHPESHRLVAFGKLRQGDFAGAFAAGERGVAQRYPSGRFLGAERILREDLGLLAAAWIKAEPARRAEIQERLAKAGGTVEDAPSLRFVLTWETDANDVDFHIEDASGAHAFYREPRLPNGGGELYADVTTGYGPECFTIRKPRAERSASYKLSAHYYSRGPMGYGMGKLEIIDHDGHGGLTFEERPFVVMADHATVDLGVVTRKP
jgi:hypothetical protein